MQQSRGGLLVGRQAVAIVCLARIVTPVPSPPARSRPLLFPPAWTSFLVALVLTNLSFFLMDLREKKRWHSTAADEMPQGVLGTGVGRKGQAG